MSDFITELRREVVGAHAAHRHRSAPAARLRVWRPALAGAAALAAVVAVVLAVRSLPAPEPAEPKVVKVLRIGGIPVDGVLAGGSLWVTDTAGHQVVRIDAAKRRVVARVPLDAGPEDIAAGDGGIWARTPTGVYHVTWIRRIDPASNRVVARVRADAGSALAVGAGTAWTYDIGPEEISRVAPSGALRPAVRVKDVDGLAFGGETLWAISHNGTVTRSDAASGRVLHRWPQLAASDASADSSEALVADATGAWVLSTDNAKVFRLERDRVARELDVDAAVPPILARTRDGLWIAAGDEREGYRVTRIDPRSGDVTASVELAAHRPRALVPVAGGLWAVCGDGTAVLIDT